MSEDTPPMVAPLVDLLGNSGLRAVKGYLPKPAKPAFFSQYVGEVKHPRKRTSSEPSGVLPAMQILPTIFRDDLDLLIYKSQNSNHVETLCPTLLFDIEANMHHKRLGKEAILRVETFGCISPRAIWKQKTKISGTTDIKYLIVI
eukprot:14562732-Ditylum_brightwellii.AAC.5